MRLKVNNVRVSLLEETSVKEAAAKKLGLKKQDIDNLQIVRRAVDARRKNNISLNYHVLIDLEISSKQLGRLVKDKDVTLLAEESLVERFGCGKNSWTAVGYWSGAGWFVSCIGVSSVWL